MAWRTGGIRKSQRAIGSSSTGKVRENLPKSKSVKGGSERVNARQCYLCRKGSRELKAYDRNPSNDNSSLNIFHFRFPVPNRFRHPPEIHTKDISIHRFDDALRRSSNVDQDCGRFFEWADVSLEAGVQELLERALDVGKNCARHNPFSGKLEQLARQFECKPREKDLTAETLFRCFQMRTFFDTENPTYLS